MLFSKKENDLIIAADGGYDTLKKSGLSADVLLGDFDSIDELPRHEKIIKYPSEKDDTDTFLAYNYGKEMGYETFVIFGGIGGRIDHSIANIKTLFAIANNGGRGFLVGNDAILTVITNSGISFSADHTGYVSLFSIGNSANKVTIRGLKYNMENSTIESSSTLGTSNEFVGERAYITVEDGSLMVIWYENQEAFLRSISDYVCIKKEL